jgi:hypothetical protein
MKRRGTPCSPRGAECGVCIYMVPKRCCKWCRAGGRGLPGTAHHELSSAVAALLLASMGGRRRSGCVRGECFRDLKGGVPCRCLLGAWLGMWRLRNALRRCVTRRSVGNSSNFGKILSKEQQEYTSNYVSACAFEPPQVSHVSAARCAPSRAS